jgi:hypothetical protein
MILINQNKEFKSKKDKFKIFKLKWQNKINKN